MNDSLVASVPMYRLAFGQPRQDEFADYVMTDADEHLREELAEVRIDVRPPKRCVSGARTMRSSGCDHRFKSLTDIPC